MRAEHVIHPEHVTEFVHRIEAYRASSCGFVREQAEGVKYDHPVSKEERANARAFLEARGITIEPSRPLPKLSRVMAYLRPKS